MREFYYLNADGLRIYFGAYGKEDLMYPNHMTVIFVPTYLDEETGKHKDIIIDDDNDEEYLKRAANKVSKMGITKNLDSIGLCPPGCDGEGDLSYPYTQK
ncbi:hypothetical protein [Paraflavitalea speifideaquila]|uniref:hypothetical protein n=1 Tax=Paraflavitalea speifideaquila TaxID=3076558 RepID=UPI0028F0724D|nr:hypothetical protein [Paraflavitalea speifideiaquila]